MAKKLLAKKKIEETHVESESEEEQSADLNAEESSDEEVDSDEADGDVALGAGDSEDDQESEDEEDEEDDDEEAPTATNDGDSEDDEESEDDENTDGKEVKKNGAASAPAKLNDKVVAKYSQLKGKQLFVRFPYKIPEEEADVLKEVNKLCGGRCIKVHRPRQPWARFCLVDFASPEDRNKAHKDLQKATLPEDKKLHVEIPKTENESYVQKIAELRTTQKQKQKAKQKLKKLAAKESENFSATVVISNIPPTSTVADIKELYPNVVDVRFKFAKGAQETSTAYATFPTPRDATEAKKRKLKIEENDLRVQYAVARLKKKENKRRVAKNSKKQENGDGTAAVDQKSSKPPQKQNLKRKNDGKSGQPPTKKAAPASNEKAVKKNKSNKNKAGASPIKQKNEAAPKKPEPKKNEKSGPKKNENGKNAGKPNAKKQNNQKAGPGGQKKNKPQKKGVKA